MFSLLSGHGMLTFFVFLGFCQFTLQISCPTGVKKCSNGCGKYCASDASHDRCCCLKSYNAAESGCCDGVVYSKERYQCCKISSGETVTLKTNKCCGSYTNDAENITGHLGGPNDDLCCKDNLITMKRFPYNSAIERCCDGKIFPKDCNCP